MRSGQWCPLSKLEALGARKWHCVVSCNKDEGFICASGSVKCLQNRTYDGVPPRNTLVIVCEIFTDSGHVRQEVGNNDFVRCVRRGFNTRVRSIISEAFTRPMRITAADVKIKGCVYVLIEKLGNLCCYVHRASGINFRFKIEGINAYGFNVFLSDARRRESMRFQNFRHRLHVFVCAEIREYRGSVHIAHVYGYAVP